MSKIQIVQENQDQTCTNDQQQEQQQKPLINEDTKPLINEDKNEIQQLEEIGIKVLNHWQTGDLNNNKPGDGLKQKADDEKWDVKMTSKIISVYHIYPIICICARKCVSKYLISM